MAAPAKVGRPRILSLRGLLFAGLRLLGLQGLGRAFEVSVSLFVVGVFGRVPVPGLSRPPDVDEAWWGDAP